MSGNEDTQPQLASGVYAALATPRRLNLMEADAAAMLDYLDMVVRAGVDGLVLFGSTGEFIHFDNEERMRVLALAIRRSRVPVLVNVSHSTLEGAVELAENAVGLGAAGLLLMPPYYYQYSNAQIKSFFENFAREAGDDTPRYLYNIPSCTNPISAELARELLASLLFAGIKDSGQDSVMFETLRALRADVAFRWLVGHEGAHQQARLSGADGVVSGVAAAVPELPVALDRAICSKRDQEAKRLNQRMAEFIEWVEKFPGTVAIKQCAAHRGWPLNHFAFPLGDETERELTAFRLWLDQWLPIVLSECA